MKCHLKMPYFQVANGREIAEAIDVFRYPDALLDLAQELANRKQSIVSL